MQCFRVDIGIPFAGPYCVIRNSQEASDALGRFYVRNKITDILNDDFFADNVAICFMQHESSGSIRHTLKDVVIDEDITIRIVCHMPYIGTCDMASWLCIVSLPKEIYDRKYPLRVVTLREWD